VTREAFSVHITFPSNNLQKFKCHSDQDALICPDDEFQPLAAISALWADSGNSIGAKMIDQWMVPCCASN